MTLAQFSKIDGNWHLFTAIVKVNLFFVHLHDVGSVKGFQTSVFFAPIGSGDGWSHWSGVDGLTSGGVHDNDLNWKSLLINLYTLFEKSNFCPKIQFWQKKTQAFHEFFSPKNSPIFLWNQKLSTAKKSKTTTFSRVFHPKKSTIFSGNQSCIFGHKMKISNSVVFVKFA